MIKNLHNILLTANFHFHTSLFVHSYSIRGVDSGDRIVINRYSIELLRAEEKGEKK